MYPSLLNLIDPYYPAVLAFWDIFWPVIILLILALGFAFRSGQK
jgi:hypothetical protein